MRLGGHFRTEPATPLPEIAVENDETTGPDPYVGVRPAFDLTAEAGAALLSRALGGDRRLAGLRVAFDPERATATLTGALPESSLRRAADRRHQPAQGPLYEARRFRRRSVGDRPSRKLPVRTALEDRRRGASRRLAGGGCVAQAAA